MKSYWVYIITNKSGTLYTGITNNLVRRIFEHKQKIIPGFTTKYNIDKLIFFQEFSNPNDAIAAEKKIKGWTRKKKIDLVKSINPDFKELSFWEKSKNLLWVQDLNKSRDPSASPQDDKSIFFEFWSYIFSGAEIPIRSKVFLRTILVASSNWTRAAETALSSAEITGHFS